jgi:aminopeptidase YwaD
MKFNELCIERPLGSDGNNTVLALLNKTVAALKYKVIELPLECRLWEYGDSSIAQGNNKIRLCPSPFSQALSGEYKLKAVSTVAELKAVGRFDGLLVFDGDLTKDSLMPRNYPFYFPDEHKEIYDLIEEINPKGIITVSGQDPASGLNPFPIFDDANMTMPTAYTSDLGGIDLQAEATIVINSGVKKAASKQLIYRKEGKKPDIILIAAHMDSKYGTRGALDNAAGLYTLCEIAKSISELNTEYTIELLPFNGEESPEASGELAYLQYLQQNGCNIKTMINIDAPGHIGSENMFSFFNFDDAVKAKLVADNKLLEGEPWYSGDHTMFAFQGTPCIIVTSSDMFTDSIRLTHTEKDVANVVDVGLLEKLSGTVKDIVGAL